MQLERGGKTPRLPRVTAATPGSTASRRQGILLSLFEAGYSPWSLACTSEEGNKHKHDRGAASLLGVALALFFPSRVCLCSTSTCRA